jgi:hypothetical protein
MAIIPDWYGESCIAISSRACVLVFSHCSRILWIVSCSHYISHLWRPLPVSHLGSCIAIITVGYDALIQPLYQSGMESSI